MLKTTQNLWLRLCFQLLLVSSFLNFPAFARESGTSLTDLQRAVQRETDQNYPYLETLYRYFHSHPELSFQERNTSARLATELKTVGFDAATNIGGYGWFHSQRDEAQHHSRYGPSAVDGPFLFP
jgi:hypothetical protein